MKGVRMCLGKLRRFLADMPFDAYGNKYAIGGNVLSERFGIGKVLGVAVGKDGTICIVCQFEENARWRTWLVRADECVAVDLVDDKPRNR